MRISKFNFWKLISFVLFLLVVFVAIEYFQTYRQNLPYKKELRNLQILFEKTREENIFFQKKILGQKDPLNLEKEKKDKLGEALEDERIILISEDLLRSINFPFLVK